MRYLFAAIVMAAAPATADDLAARFAARPAATSVALSPDGDKVAYIGAYKTSGRAVFVADLKSGDSRVVLGGQSLEMRPSRCAFKTETRLVCTFYGVADLGGGRSALTRLVAVGTDGSNVKFLNRDAVYYGGSIVSWLPDDPHHILVQVSVQARETIGSNIRAAEAGIGAALVDIDTGAQKMVEPSRSDVFSLDADDRGEIRFRMVGGTDPGGFLRREVSYSARTKGSREWHALDRGTLDDASAIAFDGFDATGDMVYELAPLDGRKALFAVATDGSGTRRLVYAHPSVDVDGVQRIGKYQRPIGATFTVDRGEISYFDPAAGALAAKLQKALAGHPDITIVDESWDGTKQLIMADGANVPPRYYLYDTTAKKLGPLVAAYPGLDGVALGSVTAVRYAARDGTMIPAYLTLPPGHSDAHGLPGLVLPHGGPEARDAAGFDWLPQFFAAQGFAVLQPNFRGSTGYGEAFFAKNGFKSWELAIGDVADGGRWLVAQGVPASKLAIFGWSYGGYAALQANVVDPGLFKAIVAVAPVTDLALLNAEAASSADARLVRTRVGDGPHILAGSPARHAASFAAPVLIFHGDHDLNVDIEQSKAMVGALKGAGKRVEFVQFKNLDHQLDDSDARTQLLAKSAEFLKAAIN